MRNVRRFLAAWRSSSQGDQPGHRCVSSLLRLLLLLPLLALAGTAAPGAADLASHSQDQIRALQEEKGRRTPAQRKLDSQLLIACRQHRGELMAPGVAHLRPGIRHRQADRVLVDIQAEVRPELLALLRRAGGSVVNSFPQHQAIRAWLPLGAVESVAEWAQVRNVRPAAEAATNVGSVTSEGDLTHQAGLGRPSYAVDGTGIKIGVLSDGVTHLAESQARGDLPEVTVLPGQAGQSDTGEGTAMLEIVHDLAPGADLFFATALGGPAAFAENIRSLHAAGCRIIIDDVTYFDESPFQDGVIARAVNDVSAQGTLYFSSAGNSGNKSDGTSSVWEGDFRDGGAASVGRGGRLHDFGGSTLNPILPGGGFRRIDLYWNDPLGRSGNDYDVYLLDAGGNVVASSTNVQNGNDDPYESIGSLGTGDRVVVVKFSGAGRFLRLSAGRGYLTHSTTGVTFGHNASGASNAFCVAATWVRSPAVPFAGGSANPVETFSSGGPRRIYYSPDGTALTPTDLTATGGLVLAKPDLTAADGVSTSVPGFETFFGTSAAAPHAAAVAALVWSYNPTLSPGEVRSALSAGALDIEAPGFDLDSGVGIVMVPGAIEAARAPSPKLTVGGLVVAAGNGNGLIDANECNQLFIQLHNAIGANGVAASNVTVTLRSLTSTVAVDPAPISFPNVPAGQNQTNATAFAVSSSSSFVCGSAATLEATIRSSNAGTSTQLIQLPSPSPITGPGQEFASTDVPRPIPDVSVADTTVQVSGISVPLAKVTVSVHITHSYVSDLILSLIGPDGTEVELSNRNGNGGQNYGSSCSARTRFDDDSTNRLVFGNAPFTGPFQPQTPLSVFVGKTGNEVNGTWTLRVRDVAEPDVGIIQCWSLLLSPILCVDGGGSCFEPPAITQQPQPVFTTNGLPATFQVQAVGTQPLAYQWFFQSTAPLAAGTNATLTLASVTPAQAGTYSVVITNRYGRATSDPVALTVLFPPSIITPPVGLTVTNGSSASFTVLAQGTAPLQFQWFRNSGTLLSEATNATFTIPITSLADAGTYFVRVSNPFGTTSSVSASLIVVAPPVFVVQPRSVSTNPGAQVTFTAQVEGTTPLELQWYFNENTPIAGATSPTLTLLNVGTDRNGTYSLVASNAYGKATSSQALLEVIVPNLLPTVTLLTPTNNASFVASNLPVVFTATAADSDGQVLQVDYSADGVFLGTGTGNGFRFEWRDPSPGSHSVQAVAVDNLGGRSQAATARIVVSYPAATALRLISAGSVWKYLDDGSDQGTAWADIRFPDGAWAAGPAELGYGDATQGRPEATVLSFGPDPNHKPLTYYFRQSFTLSDAGAYTNLNFRLMRDDGAIVYLNGREVFRNNLPTNAVAFDTPANANVNGGAEAQFISNPGSPDFLVDGTNVVAVEIHQESITSSDISFDLELTGIRNLSPRIIEAPEPATVDAGQTAEFAVMAKGGLPLAYQWYFNQTSRLAQATNPTLTLTSLTTNQAGLYTVIITNAFGSVTTAPVALTVIPSLSNQPPTVALTSPAPDATLTSDQLPLRIQATAQDPEGSPLQVEFFADGTLLGTSVNGPYELEWTDPSPQSHLLWAVATDVGGLSTTSAVVRVTIEVAPSGYYRLVSLGSVWNYHDKGTDLGTNWVELGYDDSSWSSGPAELGYGETSEGRPEATLIGFGPSTANKFPTAYFRRTFNLSESTPFTALRLSLLRDDGAVVYLNGVEVMRENLPSGPIAYTNRALITIGNAAETNLVITNLTGAPFRSGRNVVAVEMHQVNASSTDLSFDLQVEALRLPLPQITRQPTSQTVTNGGNASFEVTAVGSAPLHYQWFKDQVLPLTSQTNPVLRLNAVTLAQKGFYRCEVSNAFGSVVSADALLTVLDPLSNLPPTVSLSAPTDSSLFNLGSTIALAATASDPDGQVTRVEFFAGTSLLGSDTEAPYSINWVPNLPGEVVLTSQAIDNLGARATSGPVRISLVVPTQVTSTLVATGSVWRYLDTGVDPGTTWRRSEFNDRNWKTGPAILGYGNSSKGRPEATLIGFGTDPNNRFPTYYFRRQFVVTNVANIARLQFGLLRDDGASVYLNGTRIIRDNLPGGTLSFNTLAVKAVVDGDETRYFPTETGTALLVNGTNTLAVEVHQVSRSSDDLAFDLGLTATLDTAPIILSQPASLAVTNGDSATFRVIAVGTGTLSYQWLFNGSPINNANQSTLTFNTVTTNRAGTYAVTVRNSLGTVQSSNAFLRVIVPPRNERPVVTLLTPTNTASFIQGEIISLNASATDPDGSVAFVDFYSGSTQLGRLTQAPYLFDWRNAPTGALTLRALAVDNLGATNLSSPVSVTVRPLPPPPTLDVTLISTGAVWKYLDTGVDQGRAWRGLSFDDSTWAAGPAELGYGDTSEGRPEATVLSFGPTPANKHITYYFRHAFVLDSTSGVSNVVVHLMRDDGGVVYLNDTEIFRSNMPTGEVQFATLASGAVNKLNETTFFTTNVTHTLLRPGTNIVAVEIHQSAPESSDISFDLALTGTRLGSPVIVVQPRDQRVTPGARVEFGVTAVGAPPLTYQWFLNGLNAIPTGTNATLVLPAVGVGDEGVYSVVVANDQGQVRSSPARLELLVRPTITTPPQDQTVGVGATVEFTVTASGSSELTYQWLFNGTTTLAGATNATLRLSNVQLSQAGRYSVRVSNPAGSITSSEAILTVSTVNPPVIIVSQPQDLTIVSGSPATFTVGATGTPPFTYQWFFNANTTPTEVAGATNASLVLPTPGLAATGFYSVKVSNGFSSATSTVAELRILFRPVITSLTLSNSQVTLLFNSLNRLKYTVESKDLLTSPIWTAVPGATQLKGTGIGISVVDPNPGPAVRFYRVIAE